MRRSDHIIAEKTVARFGPHQEPHIPPQSAGIRYEPKAWLQVKGRSFRHVRAAVAHLAAQADLPECEMGCPWVIQQVTAQYWEYLHQRDRAAPSQKSANELDAHADEKLSHAAQYRKQILDYTCPLEPESNRLPEPTRHHHTTTDFLGMSEEDRHKAIMQLMQVDY